MHTLMILYDRCNCYLSFSYKSCISCNCMKKLYIYNTNTTCTYFTKCSILYIRMNGWVIVVLMTKWKKISAISQREQVDDIMISALY